MNNTKKITATHITAEKIDALLPQTQCGLCNHGGCMPYAEAIIEQAETLNLCPPGGVKTLKALGNLLQQDVSALIPAMEKTAKPAMLAVIREEECIGCTKCIQACPVDAIIGTGKQMHTIIAAECTGCELCVAPCPVDCIDMVIVAAKEDHEQQQQANKARQRYYARQERLAQNKRQQIQKHQRNKINTSIQPTTETMAARKAAIAAAIARVKAKKS
jgi:electron transport complex protein RnfB